MPSQKNLHLFVLTACALTAAVQGQAPAPAQRPRTALETEPDCNANGVNDRRDIALGTSLDCNGNGLPDECDLDYVFLLSESFETGLPAGWITEGSWHVTDQCPRPGVCHGTQYLYFGVDDVCTFAYSSLSGSVRIPDIDTPLADSLELHFCSAYQGEGMEPYDAADVFVNDVLVDHVSSAEQLDWEERRIDLSHLAGQTVAIRFDFNAMDSAFNDVLGWQIDNVRLVASGPGTIEEDCDFNGRIDACEADCNRNGVPDGCELAAAPAQDCNLNGVPDECDTSTGGSLDCNLNGIPDECDLSISLHATVANLDASHTLITSFFPDRYDFSEGETGTCIFDGGLGMFNCGNQFLTNRAVFIPYTGSSVVRSPAFGPQSVYFSAKYDGLFVLAAADCDLLNLQVHGLNGAMGGTVDTLQQTIQVGGEAYTYYVKRVYGTPEPSVNQIFVIPGDGTGVTHSVASNSVQSRQRLDGLAGIDRFVYALVSRHDGQAGLALRPVDAQEIVRELLGAVPAPASTDGDGNGIPDECE